MRALFIIGLGFISLIVHTQEVHWYTFEEAVELNKKEPRKIMVDVYTDWCGYCKKMDKTTFKNKTIVNYLNAKYYPVKLDAEQKDSIIFKNYTFKHIANGRRGVHELAHTLLQGKMSYPTTVFLNENIEILHIQKGFIEATSLDPILKFFGGNHYQKESWESWRKGYSLSIN